MNTTLNRGVKTGNKVKQPRSKKEDAPSYVELYEESEKATAKAGKTVYTDKMKDGNPIWQDTPSIEDQLTKFPQSVKIGPPIATTYDMADEVQVKAYNAILEKTNPPNSPSIHIEDKERVFDSKVTGSFKIFIQYRKLQYKKLVTKPTA